MAEPRLLIDADACPVKAEAEKVATRHGIPMLVVSNGGIRPSPNPLVQSVFVAEGPDEADKWIASQARSGDVVVTADVPTAERCAAAVHRSIRLDAEACPVEADGEAAATRDLMSDLRSADPFRQGGGRAFSKSDRSRFLDALDRMVRQARTDAAG